MAAATTAGRGLRRHVSGGRHVLVDLEVAGEAGHHVVLAVQRRRGGRHVGADVGQLAGSVGDDVLQEVSVLLASILAVVLQLADGVDDVLAIGVGAIDDALGLVAGVLDGLSGVRVGLGEDLVGRALGDDEGGRWRCRRRACRKAGAPDRR